MLFRLFIVIFLLLLISSSSLLTLNPPSPNLTLPTAFPATNVSARLNPVSCRRGPDDRPASDYATCIPSLFRMYASRSIRTPVLWNLGDFRQWGPETDIGGCYILLDGGGGRDIFSVEMLLGPAIWAIGQCFVTHNEGMYRLAKTKVGPRKDWWLSVVLNLVGAAVGNSSIA